MSEGIVLFRTGTSGEILWTPIESPYFIHGGEFLEKLSYY
jgi:hypothetical protein